MNDTYQKMSELLDNWLSDNAKEIKMALIEKEILLEKMRKLYVQISAMETEEYAAPQPVKEEGQPEPAEKKQFTPAKTLEEDVDLFFDTEHESYSDVEEDLKTIAEEINDAQEQPSEPQPKKEISAEGTPDVFDQIEVEETPEEATDKPLTDNAEELFIEPDFEITVKPEEPAVAEEELVIEETAPAVEVKEPAKPVIEKIQEEKILEEAVHEEDDILQFIPPKSAPAKVTTPQPEVPKKESPKPNKVEEQPVSKQMVHGSDPKKESLLQKPPQRSLNDLFNERREDHSISSQYQHAKVVDLTKAISINDKFIYIKELFHNRGEDFSAAIRQLNECKNMEEAFDCLEQLKQKFFWDSKSDAYLSFCDLLRRKYS